MPDLFLSFLYNIDTSGMVKTASEAKSIPFSLGCNQKHHAWWNTANPTGSGYRVQRDAFTTALTLQTQLRVESSPAPPTKAELTAGYGQSRQTRWGAQQHLHLQAHRSHMWGLTRLLLALATKLLQTQCDPKFSYGSVSLSTDLLCLVMFMIKVQSTGWQEVESR